jgi:predicted permease
MSAVAFIPAAVWLELPARLGEIFYTIVLPMLILAGIGYLLQRRLGLDMPTLTRLNFYFLIPGVIYFSLVTSKLAAGEVGQVVLFAASAMVVMGILTAVVARLRRLPPDRRNAMVMATVFANSGNYGLPLQDLAFRPYGLGATATSLQALYMITGNVLNFTGGVLLASAGHGGVRDWRRQLKHVARFPPLYALAAAVATLAVRHALGERAPAVARALTPFWEVIVRLRGAFVAIALCTLGAQLAGVRAAAAGYPVRLTVLLRLLVGPLLGAGLVYALSLRGLVAQAMILATSTPTAVNVLLLCMEFDNHPAYAARVVLYSTLLSPVTVTLTVFVVQGGFLPGLDLPDASAEPPPATRPAERSEAMTRNTVVSFDGEDVCINGRPTYPGRYWRGLKIEGLLMNARLVQGLFDDRNLETRTRWSYPDGPWDPERNTAEFVAAMPDWRAHGLAGFTINLQGGSPEGYSREQPWHNSGFERDGTLRDDYARRLERVCDEADRLGMAVILGLFYFGQDQRLADESAVARATDQAADWLADRGYANVIVEICNECDVPNYDHAILRPARVAELIRRVQERTAGRLDTPAGRLLAGVSFGGGSIPNEDVAACSDLLLIHGNGVGDPARIGGMVRECRDLPTYRGQPIVFNEDDHYDFDRPENNMLAAVAAGAGWGFFDYRFEGEGFDEGYQCVPVNWRIRSARKRGFFGLLKQITGV